eukprot:sb/3475473/
MGWPATPFWLESALRSSENHLRIKWAYGAAIQAQIGRLPPDSKVKQQKQCHLPKSRANVLTTVLESKANASDMGQYSLDPLHRSIDPLIDLGRCATSISLRLPCSQQYSHKKFLNQGPFSTNKNLI